MKSQRFCSNGHTRRDNRMAAYVVDNPPSFGLGIVGVLDAHPPHVMLDFIGRRWPALNKVHHTVLVHVRGKAVRCQRAAIKLSGPHVSLATSTAGLVLTRHLKSRMAVALSGSSSGVSKGSLAPVHSVDIDMAGANSQFPVLCGLTSCVGKATGCNE